MPNVRAGPAAYHYSLLLVVVKIHMIFFNKKAYRPSDQGTNERSIELHARLFWNATTTELDYML